MYISKAMLNMRGDSLSSTASIAVDMPWVPSAFTAYNQAGAYQSGGVPISAEPSAGIVFSTGDTIPDSVWANQSQALFSLNTLRTYLAANLPNCVMDSSFISSGTVRVINVGGGKRTLDLNGLLGRFSYAKAFNRMYLLVSNSTSAYGAGTVSTTTVFEFTPQDLISMGVPLTDNGDGTFSLNGIVNINNISFS